MDHRSDFYAGSLGSETRFEKYEANIRAYFPVRDRDVLATQLYACAVGGVAPAFGS